MFPFPSLKRLTGILNSLNIQSLKAQAFSGVIIIKPLSFYIKAYLDQLSDEFRDTYFLARFAWKLSVYFLKIGSEDGMNGSEETRKKQNPTEEERKR